LWVETQSGLTKNYKIDICCFSFKHAALRRKSKDWLARNLDNVLEWSNKSTHKNPIKRVGLVSLKLTCFLHDISEKLLIWHLTTDINFIVFCQTRLGLNPQSTALKVSMLTITPPMCSTLNDNVLSIYHDNI
jgi:hypothetical protein